MHQCKARPIVLPIVLLLLVFFAVFSFSREVRLRMYIQFSIFNP